MPKVRVIGADGAQLGVLAREEALRLTLEAGLDLVEVAPQADPPVCRIMDFGKYKYQQNKKVTKGHSHQTKLKEIRLRPKTGDHDIEFKLNQAKGFLEQKDKVQITVVFRGREKAHIDEGKKVIEAFVAGLLEFGKVEHSISFQGSKYIATVSPK